MVQEITTQSWGSRIGGAFLGVLFGIILIIGSFILVFWNEGHGLHTAQSLTQTQQVLVPLSNTTLNPNNDLKVVYLSGLATTKEVLKDPILNISAPAIKLIRTVEMYQWRQNEETQSEKEWGGSVKETKTYSYKQVWSESIIDSSGFKDPQGHQNPATMPLASMRLTAQTVSIGDFALPAQLIDQISQTTPVDLTGMDTANLAKRTNLKIFHDGTNLYLGNDPQSPEIGNVRISVSQVLPQTVSVIAQQNGHVLQAYRAPAGQSVAILVSGSVPPDQMISTAQAENRMMTWLLRLVSLVMMIVGIGLILRPLSVLADVIPFIGSIVGFGTGVIAFIIGLLLWAIATAIAWFVVRPIFAIILLIVVVIICYFIIKHRKQKIKSAPAS